MTVYLIRHAHAGRRSAWSGDDQLRPVSARGVEQAEGVADLLAGREIGRVASSPATRCIQTVEPLATRLGLEVEVDKRLAEGGNPRDMLEAILGESQSQALCAHGDLIPEVIARLVRAGMKASGAKRCQKGSVWEIDIEQGQAVRARYHAPPSRSS